MRNFQNTFEKLKRSFVSAFAICMTVPLIFVYFEILTYLILYRILQLQHCQNRWMKKNFRRREKIEVSQTV